MWLRVTAITLCFLIVRASITRSESKPGKSGIVGMIMITPIRPGPAKKGSEFPNMAPLPNATFRVTSNERVATTFTTDTAGRFRVLLEPGHYSVALTEKRFPKPCGPFEFDVEAGKMTEVEWRCDSGMR
jgi:hypothetical protein